MPVSYIPPPEKITAGLCFRHAILTVLSFQTTVPSSLPTTVVASPRSSAVRVPVPVTRSRTAKRGIDGRVFGGRRALLHVEEKKNRTPGRRRLAVGGALDAAGSNPKQRQCQQPLRASPSSTHGHGQDQDGKSVLQGCCSSMYYVAFFILNYLLTWSSRKGGLSQEDRSPPSFLYLFAFFFHTKKTTASLCRRFPGRWEVYLLTSIGPGIG